MSEFKPVETKEELAFLNDDEIVHGYLDGWKCKTEPGSDKSSAYWHGWRNAQTDKGRSKVDVHQQRLVKSILGSRVRDH